MAVASWMLRERTFRTGRSFSRHKSENEEDSVDLDANKGANENAYEILSNICKRQGLTDGRRLGYLNVFTKLIEQMNTSKEEFFISKEEMLCCLKVGIVSDNTLVRAGGLRVIRYFISTPDDVVLLNKLQIPNLIARGIDLVLKNDHERIQAFRLSLKILNICPKYFSAAITRSLVSLANSISENKDRMANSCLAILCQLCILNPELLLECNGQTAILRSTLEISHARINECLVGCLLFLMNKPEIRTKANIQLEYLTSIYCDWQRKSRTKKDQSNIYSSSMLSILAALRTWTGVFYLCQPNNASGMKAIVDVLYLNQFEVRKAILELLYEIFGLGYEDWAGDVVPSLRSIDPFKYQDLWSLSEKFIVAEGKDILPHKAYSRPNLTEVHTALIVYSLLECGLLSALVEVIITDAILSVQAVILLGFILNLSHKLLPPEIIELSPRLPTLVHYAANGQPRERTQALMAVSFLCKIHEAFKNRPAPFSLFLHQLVYLSNWYKLRGVQNNSEVLIKQQKSIRKKTSGMQIKNVDDHIKESQILTLKDPTKWGWDHIRTSLKCQNDSFITLEEPQHRNFIRKLMTFYKPSSDEYSSMKCNFKTQDNNIYTTTSFALWNFLLLTDEGEPKKILMEFLTDLHSKLKEIISESNIHEILFSPQQLNSTMCQHYFLMVGLMLSTESGVRALEKCSILPTLMEIVENSKHELYVKLILSSLNYNTSSMARDILSKAMSSPTDSIRMYSTELLLVLARGNVHHFSKWGLDLLIGQMYDENKVIATASINILHELSYDQEYLESLINIRPSLLHLGDKGRLLLIRFLSTSSGFMFLNDANFVQNELENWEKEYNYRYVGLMEGDLHDNLTLYQRTEDGKYSRRFINNKHRWKDVYVYPHLYGELSQHEKGFQALVQNGFIFKMIQVIQNGNCGTDAEIMELKSSLWGLSNMATSTFGLQLLEQDNLVQKIVFIAQKSPVLTVRATAFYSICLISTTVDGANALSKYGWYSVRHNRCEKWPIIQTEYLLMDEANDLKTQDDYESASSITYESDDAESITYDNPKLPYDCKGSLTKVKKASTLPTGMIPNFEEKYKLERGTMESQSSEGSDDAVKTQGVPIVRRNHQRSYSESTYRKKRHSSDTSHDGSEGYQKLSFQDAVGLATLQSLHNYRRPEIISTFNSELEQSEFRKNFEAPNPPKLFSNASSTSLSSLVQQTPQFVKNETKVSHCTYQGISLPKILTEFLVMTEMTVEAREDRKGLRKRGSQSFSEMQQVKELEEEVEEDIKSSCSSNNSDSEESKVTGKTVKEEGRIRHDPANCIECCMKVCKEKRQRRISNEGYRFRTAMSSTNMISGNIDDVHSPFDITNVVTFADTKSSHGNLQENSPVQSRWRSRTLSENVFNSFTCDYGDCLTNVETRRDGGPDGCQETEPDASSSSAHATHKEASSQTKIRRDVLKHISRMCNPVWAKASEQSLLHFKQSHPNIFQDPCLYSSVCDILSNSACRVTARRFIQELFLDVSFLKVFEDAANVLEQYSSATTAPRLNLSGDAPAPDCSNPISLRNPNDVSTDKGYSSEETAVPKTMLVMPKSKCTSPTNLTTLFENVTASHFEQFSDTENNQSSSSHVQLIYNSNEETI
ncbi:hypothetical protein RUM43_008335 [Polyplax serrata]|uniref:Rapamycin-insensitive companion of mTOR n=1 Tax=Polyplax serrata TaxID=468196 RepID=A0AAN8PNB6_POLSC